MGATSDDGRDDPPSEMRIAHRPQLVYERWHYHMPPNPPEWPRMGPLERAEWEEGRRLTDQYRLLTHEMRVRKLLPVDDAYWRNQW